MRVASRAGNPIRRMCTAVAEEAPPGPFSLSDPTMQGVLGTFACVYVAVIRWQFKDKALAKDVAAHKAKNAPAEPLAEISPIIAVPRRLLPSSTLTPRPRPTQAELSCLGPLTGCG